MWAMPGGGAGTRCSRRATRNLLVLACEALLSAHAVLPEPYAITNSALVSAGGATSKTRKSFTRNEWMSGRESWQRGLFGAHMCRNKHQQVLRPVVAGIARLEWQVSRRLLAVLSIIPHHARQILRMVTIQCRSRGRSRLPPCKTRTAPASRIDCPIPNPTQYDSVCSIRNVETDNTIVIVPKQASPSLQTNTTAAVTAHAETHPPTTNSAAATAEASSGQGLVGRSPASPHHIHALQLHRIKFGGGALQRPAQKLHHLCALILHSFSFCRITRCKLCKVLGWPGCGGPMVA